jgi:hypothetical protein
LIFYEIYDRKNVSLSVHNNRGDSKVVNLTERELKIMPKK